jgi:hypothetical protein
MSHRSRRPIDASTTDRRTALRIGAGAVSMLLLPAGSRAADAVDAPRIRFLAATETRDALRHARDTYYADMALREIRMRMNSPMAGVSLADARIAVRDLDVGAALDFTDEERAAIRDILARVQPVLQARAPLYARTPWSFIKTADRAEFGFAYTRGPHIVLPAADVTRLVARHRAALAAGASGAAAFGASILVHEQTHVLQRSSPSRFEPLFTDVMGFIHATPGPMTPWLDAQVVRNPDAPDLGWVMPLDKIGASGWVMPLLSVRDVDVPRPESDFRSIGVDVEPAGTGWAVVQRDGRPNIRALAAIPGYAAHFPFTDEFFHPNEIAAVMLSHWILQDVPDLDSRPLIAQCAAWARNALA